MKTVKMKPGTISNVHIRIILILLCVYIFSGCWTDRWVDVISGMYTPVHGSVPTTASGINAVFVDRDHQVVRITFDDTSLYIIPFAARAKRMWPSGCPGNIRSTRVEVLDMD